MNVINATSVRDTANALAELLKQAHKPYAGARVRIAFLRESGSQFATGSIVFLPKPISARPAADYGRLLFVEEWWGPQDEALNRLSKLLEGQAEVGGHKVNFQFNRSMCFYTNQPFGPHAWSRWQCQSYTNVDFSLNQPLQHGPVLGFGLPPYLGPDQALQHWIYDFRPEVSGSQVPYPGQLVTFLPDLRARIVNALWSPGKLRVELEVNTSQETELQISQVGSKEPNQVCLATTGVLEQTIPDDTRELQIYLVHSSGDCVAHIQLRSLYDSFGEIGSELDATVRAEMDFSRGESEQVEVKWFISPSDTKETEVVETVIAFANTAGGRIYLGVGDRDLRPLGGVELRKKFGNKPTTEALQEQANTVRLLITNKVVPIPPFEVKQIYPSGEPVVVVTVKRGPSTPYGTRENQFFVRKGSSNLRPSSDEISSLAALGAQILL